MKALIVLELVKEEGQGRVFKSVQFVIFKPLKSPAEPNRLLLKFLLLFQR